MPIYVYRNLTTGETFEVEQRMIEPALTEHPETGDPVKRLIQPVGIAFKGSGFYVTDSRSSNGAAKPAAKSETKGEDGASSDGAAASGAGSASGGSAEKGSGSAEKSSAPSGGSTTD